MLGSNLMLLLDEPAETKQPKKPDFTRFIVFVLLTLTIGYSVRGLLWLLTH